MVATALRSEISVRFGRKMMAHKSGTEKTSSADVEWTGTTGASPLNVDCPRDAIGASPVNAARLLCSPFLNRRCGCCWMARNRSEQRKRVKRRHARRYKSRYRSPAPMTTGLTGLRRDDVDCGAVGLRYVVVVSSGRTWSVTADCAIHVRETHRKTRNSTLRLTARPTYACTDEQARPGGGRRGEISGTRRPARKESTVLESEKPCVSASAIV